MVRASGIARSDCAAAGYRAVPTGARPTAAIESSQTSRSSGAVASSVGTAQLSALRASGRFKKAADSHATKILVFSGWRVVPTAVAALLGYDAEREAGNAAGARNTIAARNLRNSAQLLSLRHDARKGLQRLSVLSLVYPCRELAELFDPYGVTTLSGDLPTAHQVLVAAGAPSGSG